MSDRVSDRKCCSKSLWVNISQLQAEVDGKYRAFCFSENYLALLLEKASVCRIIMSRVSVFGLIPGEQHRIVLLAVWRQ